MICPQTQSHVSVCIFDVCLHVLTFSGSTACDIFQIFTLVHQPNNELDKTMISILHGAVMEHFQRV